MTPDDPRPMTERSLEEADEGVDSEPVAQVRREGSFGDVDGEEVKTSLRGSFGELDRTPGTEGDDPTEGMVDAHTGAPEGSFGDVDAGGRVDTARTGSYGETNRAEDMDPPEGIDGQ